jgi:acyl-CoA synthetase (AMP-forming)/AMP-acid ligase II
MASIAEMTDSEALYDPVGEAAATPQSLMELVESIDADSAAEEFIAAPEIAPPLSFGQYRQAVLNLAATIQGEGLSKGDRVALVLSNGLNGAVAILAIMAAGGVAVPLNPKLTKPELAWLVENSAARLLITDRRHEESLPGSTTASAPSALEAFEPDNPYSLYTVGNREKSVAGQGAWKRRHGATPRSFSTLRGPPAIPKG